jgi:hypothetical protein
MDDLWMNITQGLADRFGGPMKFRLILQPIVACVLATLAGLKDARAGKPPYFWALATDAAHRTEMLKDGWKSVGTLFVVAVTLDLVYQYIVDHALVPREALFIAVLIAIVPYLIVRGLVNHIVRKG